MSSPLSKKQFGTLLRILYDGIMLTIGDRIQAARRQAGLRQADLGKAIGVTGKTIQRWEKSVVEVPSYRLEAIAAATGKPLTYLLDDGRDVQPPAVAHPDLAAEVRRLRQRLDALANPPGEPEPGVTALLGDPALVASLRLTDDEREALLALRASGRIQTREQALFVLSALRL